MNTDVLVGVLWTLGIEATLLMLAMIGGIVTWNVNGKPVWRDEDKK